MKVGLGLHKSRSYVRSHNRGRRPQLDAFSSDGRWFHRNSQICYLAQTAYFVRAPHRGKNQNGVEFVTLRVEQFVLKIAHLAISMEPRGPYAFGLLPRLLLLVMSIVNHNYRYGLSKTLKYLFSSPVVTGKNG